MLTDTHCHLDFNHYQKDRDAVLARAWEAGLERILVPGVDLPSSRAAVQLAETEARVFAAVGVHPNSALTWDSQTLAALEELAQHPKVVAIGEIGLDYYRHRAPRGLQERVFREQLSLAGRLNLPVVVHTRNASSRNRACIADVTRILLDWPNELQCPGVIHSYSGSAAEAKALLKHGFFIGISGPVTFHNATTLQQTVASIPLEYIVMETDGPFLTPHPHRGRRNEPAYIQYIADKIGDLHNLPPQVIAEKTSRNADQLFHWRTIR